MKNLKLIPLLALVGVLATSCCDCPSGSPDSEHIITETEAHYLQQTYFDNQHRFINLGVESQYKDGEPDNIGVIITDIDDLQKYLNAIKKEAATQGKENPGAVLFFGAKNDANNVPRSTVFFQAMHATPDPNNTDPNFPSTIDYKKLEYPSAYYDKLDPMGLEPDDEQPEIGGSN